MILFAGRAALASGGFASCPRSPEAAESDAEMKALLASDIVGFCKDAFLHRFARAKHLSDADYAAHQLSGDLDEVISRLFAEDANSDWSKSLLPLDQNRRELYEEQAPLKQSVVSSLPNPKHFDSGKKFDLFKPNKRYAEDIEAIDLKKRLFLCSDVTLLHSKACSDALALILEEMSPQQLPRTGASYGLISTTREVVSNPGYRQGLRNAVLKMYDYAKNKAVPQNSNLFDDLKSSFIEAGITEQSAVEYTWNVLGVISVGAQNTITRMIALKLPPAGQDVASSLVAITRVTPYLDSISISTGHPYSAPRGVTTSCDYTKYYHFWMAAFLARRAQQETGSPHGAAAAAFISEKGYQLKDHENDRNRPKATLTDDLFSPLNNVVRLDLAFAAAGAQYGAHSLDSQSTSKEIDIDSGIKTIIRQAGRPNRTAVDNALKLFSDDLANYHIWQRTFAPDSVFDYFDEQYE